MGRIALCMTMAGLVAVPAFGQLEFKDDFTTVATWDANSLLGACVEYGGGPLTKYTVLEGIDATIFNQRAVSGNGRLAVSDNRQANNGGGARYNLTLFGAINLAGCNMPGANAPYFADYPFTNTNVCIYGGIMWDPFDLAGNKNALGYGLDLRPGVAGVDDDCDGITDGSIGVPGVDDDLDLITDEWDEAGQDQDESPIHAGGDTFGPPYSDGGLASCPNAPSDGLPGIGGVDDDGDGTIDEFGELGMGNDSDDNGGRVYWSLAMKVDLFSNTAPSLIWLNMDAGSGGGGNSFALREMLTGNETQLEAANEISGGFYQPDTHYNYVFCVSGVCYGAMLWTGPDMANPNETVGPIASTLHTNPESLFAMFLNNASEPQYQRSKKWLGNTNFSDTFWVEEGALYPSPSSDLDGDKDVDGFDFLTFSNCYNGSNKPAQAACTNARADLDQDGDVDGFDFLTFSNCYNGSNKKPQPACFPPNLTACAS